MRAIHARLSADKGTNNSTTVKMLSVMLDKGIVRRDESESHHVYRAAHRAPEAPLRELRSRLQRPNAPNSRGQSTFSRLVVSSEPIRLRRPRQ
ncbi:MAG TPA: BlaI/MecI/CopY family transcriptional regulator, partial [Pirellulales bacterium]|nr:BlaI/MecI/CopY family transcriptional regulator [Pirellulales bacterium]